MCLAQGQQRSDAGEAQTRGPSVSSQALYHWATALPDMLRVKTIADIKLLPTFYKAKARVDIWWEFERWLSKTAIIVYVNDKGSDECTSMQSHQNLAVSLFGSSQRKVVTKNNTIRFFLQLAMTSCRFFLPIF